MRNKYFPSLKTDGYDWVLNRFIESTLCEEEELACVFSDCGLKIKHAGAPIATF